MTDELTIFLRRNDACADRIAHLEALGAETLADAWDKASPTDLVWAVTRPGVMSPEQRRQFLVMVLSSIEDKLTDTRSKNILDKLRTNEPITAADRWAASQAAEAAVAKAADAADAEAAAAARAYAAAAAAVAAASWAAEAYAADAEAAAADAAAADATAREAQAKWLRDNFVLNELNIN